MDIKQNNPPNDPAEEARSTPERNNGFKVYAALAAVCLAIWLAVKSQVLDTLWPAHGQWNFHPVERFALASVFAFAVLALSRLLGSMIAKNTKTRSSTYNLVRVLRLLTLVIVGFVYITFLFSNWYTAAVSLGLISLLLGFALQTPITSFIGWVDILVRAPYHVGDRIQIDALRGDVVEINYFDTTLWEFGGDYLTNDLPTGRLIRFPNSLVLQSAVINYSWRKFPYIWNEIPFHVAYGSDLQYVTEVVQRVAKAELGDKMEEKIQLYKSLLRNTPVDELNIREFPFIAIRTNPNTWIEVLLVYLVEPKQAGSIRTALIRKILAALMQNPEKVMFPKGDSR